MNQPRTSQWRRLDNAAKIFPPTSTRRDPKVFRFSCCLAEKIDPVLLQRALDRTIRQFPFFCARLRKGLFWYYLEDKKSRPLVCPEYKPPCSQIYRGDHKDLLFEVTYFGRRVNLEIFHALADGTGALQFLRTMIFAYLAEKYGIPGRLSDYDAAQDQKSLDAFYKYYDKYHDKNEIAPKAKRCRAYRIRGERWPDGRLSIIEGFLSVGAVLEKAHKHHATLSEFLIALLISSIYDGMAVRERTRPVVITVPVDLRRFFSARTVRNFFGLIQIAHDFRKDGEEFEQVLAHVKQSFEQQLTKEYLSGIISRYSVMENNPLIKAIPLAVKIPILRLAGLRSEGEDTAAFSNIGRIVMPAEAAGYIRLFDVFLCAKRPQLCLCSFGDTLAISVSSPLVDTGIQRRFFRSLTGLGIPLQVVSNLEQGGREEVSHASV